MRDKWATRTLPRMENRHSRIRADLERHGVAPEFSQPVADRLNRIASDLSPQEYAAVLTGVAAAYGVHRDDADAAGQSSNDVEEIQRLMLGFAGELRKLEEGLRILSAYVTRMRSRADASAPRTLH